MTIAEALKKYQDIEADLLLSHILNKTKEFLHMHPEKKLTEIQRKKFILLANYRRHGIPIAYLVGYKYFYGLKFKVTRDTLIPRPESEWLVEKAVGIIEAKLKKPRKEKLKVLDMATGSGCIIVSVAKQKYTNPVQFFAADVSEKALSIAKSNSRTHKTKIKFIKSDLFSKIDDEFDLIIANLPYVPISDYKKLKANLKYEPKLAITDGTDTFKLLKKFLDEAQNYLKPGGVLIIEVDPKFFKAVDGKHWRVVRDYKKLNRYALMNGSALKQKLRK